MAIKFFNIRSKEIRVAETEPLIAALWGSSDRGPNVTQGQDFGWRLAPEVVVELKRIKGDQRSLEEIAIRYRVMMQDVDEKLILQFISDKTDETNAPVAADGDYSDFYNDEIRRLEHPEPEATTTTTTVEPTTTTTTTEEVKTATTTTEPPETTSTTTNAPEQVK